MCITLRTLTPFVQRLFTTTLLKLALECGFTRRVRSLWPDEFIRTLVFGWIDDPTAPLSSFAPRLNLSRQALDQRMTQKTVELLHGLLTHAMTELLQPPVELSRVLCPFSQVLVDDTTHALGTKLAVRYELRTGKIVHVGLHTPHTQDKTTLVDTPELPKFSLTIRDMGYCNLTRYRDWPEGRYYLSRVPAGTKLQVPGQEYVSIGAYLAALPASTLQVDTYVHLGQNVHCSCRLVALRVPVDVAKVRRDRLVKRERNKHGRAASAEQLAMCDWSVYMTNVHKLTLSAQQVYDVYRSRWQIELLFKRCKGQLGLDVSHGHKAERLSVELLAKVVGAVVVNWVQLSRSGVLGKVSVVGLWRVIRQSAWELCEAFGIGAEAVRAALAQIVTRLTRVRKRCDRKARPSIRELLDQR